MIYANIVCAQVLVLVLLAVIGGDVLVAWWMAEEATPIDIVAANYAASRQLT